MSENVLEKLCHSLVSNTKKQKKTCIELTKSTQVQYMETLLNNLLDHYINK